MSSILETSSLHWPDEAACAASATALARHPGLSNAYVELCGPLGAGKTTFVRHLLHALGVPGRVKSPTYALMESYELERDGRRWPIHHFDFYRFDDPQEWEDAGFRDVFASNGLKLVEWPDRLGALAPPDALRLDFTLAEGDARTVRVAGWSGRLAEP